EDNVLAFDPAEIGQSLAKGIIQWGRGLLSWRQDADPPDLRKIMLCVRSPGHEQQDGKPGNDTAPFHSMTSSARARIPGAIFRPSALAALRLTTSSKVVGCWTGRSAGLTPFRIFPT